jgi:hypothetical protein
MLMHPFFGLSTLILLYFYENVNGLRRLAFPRRRPAVKSAA